MTGRAGRPVARRALTRIEKAEKLLAKAESENATHAAVLTARAQVEATLAVAEELARLREQNEPRYEVRHESEFDPSRPLAKVVVDGDGPRVVYEHGTSGLCMEPRTGLAPAFAANEFCTRPNGHDGGHSWEID